MFSSRVILTGMPDYWSFLHYTLLIFPQKQIDQITPDGHLLSPLLQQISFVLFLQQKDPPHRSEIFDIVFRFRFFL